MKLTVKYGLIAGFVVGTGMQLVRPERSNPVVNPGATLSAHVQVPEAVAAILDRSCRDCHSNETRWPWYTNVAPVSWWVIDHVNHGRSHFNYSEWGKYRPDQVADLLEGTCELTRKGAMPLASYLPMHRDARLSSEDVATLCAWTKAVASPHASH